MKMIERELKQVHRPIGSGALTLSGLDIRGNFMPIPFFGPEASSKMKTICTPPHGYRTVWRF